MYCKYKCQKCDRKWKVNKPGPHHCSECPFCGNVYFDWLNFEEVIKDLKKRRLLPEKY